MQSGAPQRQIVRDLRKPQAQTATGIGVNYGSY
jgi:hypothetical protein